VRPISPSHWELRGTRRRALLGGVQIRWDWGSTPWNGYFSDLSPRTKPYCGVKCIQGLHFPVTIVYLKAGQENYITGPLKNMLR